MEGTGISLAFYKECFEKTVVSDYKFFERIHQPLVVGSYPHAYAQDRLLGMITRGGRWG